jgi:hypothetical protein
VLLPKGTFVQIDTFARHHNSELWGPDVMQYNPDRDWCVSVECVFCVRDGAQAGRQAGRLAGRDLENET